ncbi:MAG TPA: xanthine dehydrogenase accessory protein XdhC [Alphaproteobacteria bacterium]|nr:xanthine dehydrogenase accessory protein XdhC [Rhodospirillaceae bacterium]HRJ65866.1 xanthine dehydrogenase accessory protein XdhC [Alphaproteobacteria bacterium]
MLQDFSWLSTLADLSARRVPCVLITVMEAKGSTPREAGTKMVVTADAQFGTIGGGNLEFEAVAEARKLLEAAISTAAVKDYPLGPKLAQCCGGAVSVLLESFIPTGKKLYLFGAGHVGREVVSVLSALPLDIVWVDSREGEFPAALPAHCKQKLTSAPLAEAENIDDNAYVLVMTHSHDLDYDIVRAVLQRGRFAYLGLIGSATKRARFEKRLTVDGITPEGLARLVCPIGVGGVTGKHPREIAIAVAAQLLSCGLTRTGAPQE